MSLLLITLEIQEIECEVRSECAVDEGVSDIESSMFRVKMFLVERLGSAGEGGLRDASAVSRTSGVEIFLVGKEYQRHLGSAWS